MTSTNLIRSLKDIFQRRSHVNDFTYKYFNEQEINEERITSSINRLTYNNPVYISQFEAMNLNANSANDFVQATSIVYSGNSCEQNIYSVTTNMPDIDQSQCVWIDVPGVSNDMRNTSHR